MSQLVRDGVLRAEQGRGYFVQSGVPRNEVKQITLVVWTGEMVRRHPAFAESLHGLMMELSASEHQLNLCFIDPTMDAKIIRDRLGSIHAEGIILMHIPEAALEHVPLFAEKNIPIVTVGRVIPELTPWAVLTDVADCIEQAINELIQNGKSRMVFTGCQDTEIRERRMEVFKRTFHNASLPGDEYVFKPCSQSREAGSQVARELSCAQNLPDAIIAEDDYVALGIRDVLKEKQLDIPVIAVGGFLQDALTTAGLASISAPYHDAGRVAARLVRHLISERTPVKSCVYLRCSLVSRDSHQFSTRHCQKEREPYTSFSLLDSETMTALKAEV